MVGIPFNTRYVFAILIINSPFGQSVTLSKGSYIKDVRTGRGELGTPKAAIVLEVGKRG